MKQICKRIIKYYIAIIALAVVCAVLFVKPFEGTRFQSGKGTTTDTLKSYLPTSGLILNIKANDLSAAIESMQEGPLMTKWDVLNPSNGFTVYSSTDSLNEEFKSIVNPNNIINSIAPEEGFVFKDGKKPSLKIPESEYPGCVKAPAWIVMYLIEHEQFQEDPNLSIEE